MNILIIEDEIKAARELRDLVEEVDQSFKVCGMLQSVEEAVSWLSTHEKPELILSDIQLTDGQSFEIFKQLEIDVPVIFCTAYDEYALKAFGSNGIDYLLKPVEMDKLKASFSKLKKIMSIREPHHQVEHHLQTTEHQKFRQSLLTYFQDQILPLKVADIPYLYLMNTVVYTCIEGKTYQVRETLDELAKTLDPSDFYRVNRQFIVQRKFISHINHLPARKLNVVPTQHCVEKIVVSKANGPCFLKWLQGL